ncbi:MAG TPA: hypothetical protein PKY99_14980 [Turneriella sp.]|nr:hypothetical protein [Turneriella sp.]
MGWIRSALVYLGITVLIAGAIWLFWGKSIETAWKAHGDRPTKAAREVKAAAEKKATAAMPELRQKAAPLATNLEKARSGVTGILEYHANENRNAMHSLSANNDKRWREILRKKEEIKLPSATAPAAPTSAAVSPAKKPATTTEKAVEKKAKPAAPRRSTRLEEL